MNSAIFTRTFIYVVLLLIGIVGRKMGVFHREHTKFLNAVVCNLTLPAAVINGFQGVEVSGVIFSGFAVGMFINLLLLGLAIFVTRNKSPKEKVLFIFSTGCFNVANFSMPFLNGLISKEGFAAVCMFDVTVALMLYGVNVAVAASCSGGDGKIHLGPVVKKVLTTPVVLTYFLMALLSATRIQLPGLVLELTSVVGGGNSFLAMLSIGILFQISFRKEDIKIVAKLLSLRILTCMAVCMGIYFFLPLPEDIKFALCVLLGAPCASSAPLLTEAQGGDGNIAAMINSLSLPLSIVMMVTLLTVL